MPIVYPKRPKILLVGPDCSGKSTLANQLSGHYGIPHHANRRIKDELLAVKAVVDFVEAEVRKEEGGGFILDQWQYPVDTIYQHAIYRQNLTRNIFFNMKEMLNHELDSNNVVVILVTANEATITERFRKRGDELWDLDQILEVQSMYPALLLSMGISFDTIDTSYLMPHQVLLTAKKIIDKRWGTEK